MIMMGAILNIGASVGPGTMIDMGAVLGRQGDGRRTLSHRCGRGAGRSYRACECGARHS